MKRAIVHLERRSSTVGRRCETLLGEMDQREGCPPMLSPEFLQQRFRLLEVRRVKAFGEPAIDRGQQRAGFGPLALLLPEAAQARSGTQLPGLGLLAARNHQGLLEARFGLLCIGDGLAEP